MVLEKILESPLDCKEIQPVNPKGDQSWMFVRSTDAEAETPILWPPDAKNWLIGKDPDAGKDWRQEEKGTEDEMVGCHHRFNGHEFEQAPGDSEGQGSLACCSPWVAKNRTQLSDWTATKPSLLYSISIRHRLLLYGWCHFIWKGITTLLDMEKVRVWKASILFVKFVVVLQKYLLCYLSIHAPTPRIIGNI